MLIVLIIVLLLLMLLDVATWLWGVDSTDGMQTHVGATRPRE